MGLSGFEGLEKRLELHFSGGDSRDSNRGLRSIDFKSLELLFLNGVKPSCTADSTVRNKYLDSYVLSESSLFVYPTKIIIKTCGTAQICGSIDQFKNCAQNMGLTLSVCRYTQDWFPLPPSETSPHDCFSEEVTSLKKMVPSSFRPKDVLMPLNKPSKSFGVCIACDETHNIEVQHTPDGLYIYTIQVCMIQPDRVLAENFGRKSYDKLGEVMAELTGVDPSWDLVSTFTPSPCRGSTRGIHRDRCLMIDVTQEVRSYGYASFECVGSIDDVVQMVKMVVHVFDPEAMSVSTTCINNSNASEVVLPKKKVSEDMVKAVEEIGLICRICDEDKETAVMFKTFSRPRGD